MSATEKPYYQVIAYYQVKPEQIETVKTLLNELAEGSRSEPENISYEYYCSPNEPTQFVILEKYLNDGSLKKHSETTHYKTIAPKIRALLDERRVEHYWVK